MAERIVVVGHSAVTCLGRGIDTTWAGLVAGRSGIARHETLSPDRYLQDVAGMVEGLGPKRPDADPRLSRLDARFLHLGLEAARQAWDEAGVDTHEDLDRARIAIAVGSAFGGVDLLDAEHQAASRRKSLAASPYLVPGMIINQAAGQIAEHLKMYGPSFAPANACASGGHAIITGALLLRSGEADFALCGATESAFVPWVVNGFATMKALLPRKAEDRSSAHPEQASRPFSADRAGFVLSEGAGMLVLTTLTQARKRGLRVLAELLGWSANSDGHHMAMPEPGRVADCLQTALRRCELTPEQVDYYNAHGTSTVLNDRVETKAIETVFGPRAAALPISSIKGALGHSLGAASAIEASVCVHSLIEQVIPPTINHIADPELGLDYVPNVARPARLDTVMSASFGFGGTNNALVFRRICDV
jgi:3-oxoacyl-[acyl-carrier-protein] synthase II